MSQPVSVPVVQGSAQILIPSESYPHIPQIPTVVDVIPSSEMR